MSQTSSGKRVRVYNAIGFLFYSDLERRIGILLNVRDNMKLRICFNILDYITMSLNKK